jgi:hypothetical protein
VFSASVEPQKQSGREIPRSLPSLLTRGPLTLISPSLTTWESRGSQIEGHERSHMVSSKRLKKKGTLNATRTEPIPVLDLYHGTNPRIT